MSSRGGFNLKPPVPLPFNRALYFATLVAWISTSAFQYGYHISALNSLQAVIACHDTWSRPEDGPDSYALPPCIPMSEAQFGLLTSIYTIGGLIGSVYAGRLADSRGRRAAIRWAGVAVGAGALAMSIAVEMFVLLIGRFVIGIGCGLATVLVPMYLSEIAPAHIRGSIGVLNQLAIVLGILTAQGLAIIFARPTGWRTVPFISACLALAQLVISPAAVESPKWTASQAAAAVRNRAPPPADHRDPYADADVDGEAEESRVDDALLSHGNGMGNGHGGGAGREESGYAAGGNGTTDDDLSPPPLRRRGSNASSTTSPAGRTDQLTMVEAWRSTDPAVKLGLRVVLLTQLTQQLSGINAVLYYSTSIMTAVLPANAQYVALIITFVNVPLTFVPVFLIDRLGRRPLLLFSLALMAAWSLTLAISINASAPAVAATAIIAFVASFSFGLGPIPFVLVNEVAPSHATSATASIGLGANWLANFVVGIAFLPLRDLLRTAPGRGEGGVFYVFTVVLATAAWLISRNYKG